MSVHGAQTPLGLAETYIREQTCLYRHYAIDQTQLCVEQFTGVHLSDDDAVEIVQQLRDENGLGPIAEYNLPGYVEEE